MGYTVTVTLDGTKIITQQFKDIWAARVFAAEWSVGDFAVAIVEAN